MEEALNFPWIECRSKALVSITYIIQWLILFEIATINLKCKEFFFFWQLPKVFFLITFAAHKSILQKKKLLSGPMDIFFYSTNCTFDQRLKFLGLVCRALSQFRFNLPNYFLIMVIQKIMLDVGKRWKENVKISYEY